MLLCRDEEWEPQFNLNNLSAERQLYYIRLSLEVALRGVSQVYLCDDVLIGAVILIAISLFSSELFVHCVLGVVSALFTATIIVRLPQDVIMSGRLSCDGSQVGCFVWAVLDVTSDSSAVTSVFGRGRLLAVTAALSALASVVHLPCASLLSACRLPSHTAASNCVVFITLCVVARGSINGLSLVYPGTLNMEESTNISALSFFCHTTLRGIGQIVRVNSTIGGGIILLGVLARGYWRVGLCLVLGSGMACVVAKGWLQLPFHEMITVFSAFYGSNGACVCAALGSGRFYQSSVLVPSSSLTTAFLLLVGLTAAVLTVLVEDRLHETILLVRILHGEGVISEDGDTTGGRLNDDPSTYVLPSLTIPHLMCFWATSVTVLAAAGFNARPAEFRIVTHHISV